MENAVLFNQWKIGSKIGEGAFGCVYEATNIDSGRTVAVKFEKQTSQYPQLAFEYQLLRSLRYSQSSHQTCTPRPLAFGQTKTKEFRFMVMQRLGPTVQTMIDDAHDDAEVKMHRIAVCAAGILACLHTLHDSGFVHRDVKPENFLLRSAKSKHIYMVDFGFCMRFLDAKQRTCIPQTQGNEFEGTVRFASLNMHKGLRLSRRDDLHSLCYIIAFWHRGKLPWQNIQPPAKKKDDQKRKQNYRPLVQREKEKWTMRQLGEGLPPSMLTFMDRCDRLTFEEEPPYEELTALLLGK
jgi:serine/threonine protein kinase